MRRIAIAAAALCVACGNITGIEGPDWQVSGTVTLNGAPLPDVLVSIGAFGFWGSGSQYTARTGADGTFVIHARACGYPGIDATHPKYRVAWISGFDYNACPGRLSGVRIAMEPYPPLVITTTVLPDGAPTIPYDEVLGVEGGDGNTTWSVAAGALPDGLTLEWDRIAGTPTASGTSTFTLRAASGDQQFVEHEYTVEIVGGPVVAPTESCADYGDDSAIVGFQDPELYRLVRAAAGLGPQSLVTCADAATVTELHASIVDSPTYTSLQSVAGLQNLTSLETLDLSGNAELIDVDALAGLLGLVSLDLSQSGVGKVDALAGLAALTRLDLRGVGWHHFAGDIAPLASLTSLKVLDITGDQVDDIGALTGMTSLDTLRGGQNLFDDVTPLAMLTSLRHLELFGNPIASVDALAGMTGLEYLDLNWTLVDDLSPLAGMTSLAYLDASRREPGGPNVDLSPLAGMASLETLGLWQQRVTDTSPLDGLPALTTLWLGGGDVPVLELSDLPSLEELRAAQASVGIVTLTDLPSLRVLELGNNDISDLTGLIGLDALEELYLHGNDIVDVGPLQGLTALQGLTLDGNSNLSDIGPLIANPGLGAGDWVQVNDTKVSCASVSQLAAKGVSVGSACGT